MLRAFTHRLPQAFAACYARGRFLWHLLAILVTFLLVSSGFDWWFFEHTRSAALYPLIMLAGIGGFFIPVFASVGLYIAGEWRHKEKDLLVRAGTAVAQASIVALVITSIYKVFTGRTQPEFLTDFSATDMSHAFHLGFFQNGVFWGWPSSHAAVAVAGAVALSLVWRSAPVRAAAAVWAAVVSAGAAVGFHWFSDVLAGIIIGAVAGIAAGERAAARQP